MPTDSCSHWLFRLLLAAVVLVPSACGRFTGPYGSEVGKLRPGMSKDAVMEALGTPYGESAGMLVYYQSGRDTALAILLCENDSHATCGWALLEVPVTGPPKTFSYYKIRERSDKNVPLPFAVGITVWVSCDICKAARQGDLEKAKALLNVNPNLVLSRDNENATPLHYAARAGHKDAAALLLANKAEINARDDQGDTPLHEVAAFGHKDVAELLLTNHADVNATNGRGETPLGTAVHTGNKDVAVLLRQHGAHE